MLSLAEALLALLSLEVNMKALPLRGGDPGYAARHIRTPPPAPASAPPASAAPPASPPASTLDDARAILAAALADPTSGCGCEGLCVRCWARAEKLLVELGYALLPVLQPTPPAGEPERRTPVVLPELLSS